LDAWTGSFAKGYIAEGIDLSSWADAAKGSTAGISITGSMDNSSRRVADISFPSVFILREPAFARFCRPWPQFLKRANNKPSSGFHVLSPAKGFVYRS
jgi:hypothetical protein